VRCLWALDASRAHARFYPAIDPLISYSEDVTELAAWWQAAGNPEWAETRRRFLALLEQQTQLERMARIVGKDALPSPQQLTLLCAELINEGFLRQSSLSPVDRFCSPQRQSAMMHLIRRFIELAQQALAAGIEVEALQALPILRRLHRMGEELGEGELDKYDALGAELESAFTRLNPARE
jgi:V/A-type H+-transporting ATPase subunit A